MGGGCLLGGIGLDQCADFRRPPGDGWAQPLLLRHDSVDSGVSKGSHGGLVSGAGWKEAPAWHGPPWGQEGAGSHHHHHGRHQKRGGGDRDRDRDRQGGHRQRNGNFHSRKGAHFQDKFSDEERKEDKLKFVEEDFVSNLQLALRCVMKLHLRTHCYCAFTAKHNPTLHERLYGIVICSGAFLTLSVSRAVWHSE